MSQIDRDYEEKRDFIRMTVDAKVTVEFNGQTLPGICRDLSSNGMQVTLETQTPAAADDVLIVHMASSHPTLKDLRAEAKVVRVGADPETGNQVLGLSILTMD
ncbi:PilZ domain-containing protein [Pseudomonas sp. nanlin1]|uniref:PilZ domain-containing protein n=1 Tax=Pseudomonas sp. nanlin1 TaxID=3040605 RepID=UPI00388D9C8E